MIYAQVRGWGLSKHGTYLAINAVVGPTLLEVCVREDQVQAARILIDNFNHGVIFWYVTPRLVSKRHNVAHNTLLGAVSVILEVAATHGRVRGVQNLVAAHIF